MAKIGNLEVDTLNLDYLSSFASGVNSVIAVNAKVQPVQLYWAVAVTVYVPASGGVPTNATVRISVIRARGTKTFYNRVQLFNTGGTDTFNFQVNGAALDWDAAAGDTYNYAATGSGSGSVSYTGKKITAISGV